MNSAMTFASSMVIALMLVMLSTPVAWTQFTTYQSAPTISYTFDTSTADTISNITWLSAYNQHSGIAYFNGQGQFLNLTQMVDTAGRKFPDFSGTISLEFWVNFASIDNYGRVFDCAQSLNLNSLAVGSTGTSPSMFIRTWNSPVATSTRSATDQPYVVTPNLWQHFVVAWAQIAASDNSSITAANVTIIRNGDPVPSSVVAGVLYPMPAPHYLPPLVNRPACYIGRSQTSTDSYFQGWLDSLYMYNYALSAEQSRAHFLVPRPPILDLAFSFDPRLQAGLTTTAGYGWIQKDTSDSSTVQSLHNGLVTFDGSSQYVDLSTISGSRSLGTTIPTFGGTGGATSNNGLISGLTFEATIKLNSASSGAGIIDLGTTAGNNDILLSITSSGSIQFQTIGSATTTLTLVSSPSTGVYYHIVVIMPASGAFVAYVNGVSVTSSGTSPYFPTSVSRPNTILGRANSGTTYFNGAIDSFRLYDYAITSAVAIKLYNYTQTSTPITVAPVLQNSSWVTYPINSYTFDLPPPTQYLVAGNGYDTTFTWLNTTGNHYHQGIASFNGQTASTTAGAAAGGAGDLIDMNEFLDGSGYGIALAQPNGRSMSFEVWCQFLTFTNYGRIFDIAGPLGQSDNNILLFQSGSSSTLIFQIYYGSQADPAGAVSTSVSIANGWKLGQWQHILCTVSQNFANDSTSSVAATLSVYINGQLAGSSLGYLPIWMNRPNAFIAKSNWGADGRFNGLIDGFWIYNYALTADEAAAHAAVTKPPFFELTFNVDPRIAAGNLANANYTWFNQDPNNVNDVYHTGIVVLSGVAGQYIDLAATSGPSALGTAPRPMGGQGSGTGDSVGWTFEIYVKDNGVSTWAKVMDFGNGPANGNIMFGNLASSTDFTFESWAGDSTQPNGRVTCQPAMVANTWYHVVAVLTPLPGNYGAVACFVNGVFSGYTESAGYIQNVTRSDLWFGRSDWAADSYFNGAISAFRIFDYALTTDQVRNLYAAVSGPPATIPAPLYTTGPSIAYTFDQNPVPAEATYGGSFTWYQNNDTRYGVADFNGVNQYVNLLTEFDSYGNVFPNTIGGFMSFEGWVKFRTFGSYSRIFDLSNGQNSDNIILCNWGTLQDLYFEVYLGSVQNNIQRFGNAWPSNVWVHVAVTYTNAGNGLSYRTVYLNGVPYVPSATDTSTNPNTGNVPNTLARANAYLGKSPYTDNAYFNGQMDSFYYYNYGLTQDIVQAHFVLPKPPIFELTFAVDPRIAMGTQTTANYSWLATDPNDVGTAYAGVHSGMISLSAALSNYIDLGTPTGMASVGVVLPAFGGAGSANTGNGLTMGCSLELVFKATTQVNQVWAKIFSFGEGQYEDNVFFGWNSNPLSTYQLNHQVFNTRAGPTSGTGNLIFNSPVLGRWYHVTFVWKPFSLTYGSGTTTMYIDGVAVSTMNTYYPDLTQRSKSYLGRSNWAADAFWEGLIDKIALYDYALDPNTVASLANLFNVTGQNSSGTSCTSNACAPSAAILNPFNSAPQYSLTFDSAPPSTVTNYTYKAGYGGHQGVAYFNGLFGQSLNLSAQPDSNGVTFPTVIGGAMSFEFWTSFQNLDNWGRLIDLGNGANSDNILVASEGTSNSLSTHLYQGSASSGQDFPFIVTPNVWQHIAVTISQYAASDTSSNGAGVITLYVNGINVPSLVISGTSYMNPTRSYLPSTMARYSNFMGRSNWAADSSFQGWIDSMYFYNYPVPQEAIVNHYTVPRPPSFEAVFASDPRVIVGLSTAGYSWFYYDSADNVPTANNYHTGLLSMSSASQQYVDLNAVSGNNAIGQPISTFGGSGVGNSDNGLTVGMTVECTFKLRSVQANSAVFDIGNGAPQDNIMLTQSSSGAITFTAYTGTTPTTMSLITSPALNTYYHVIVTMQSGGPFRAYVNGVSVLNVTSPSSYPSKMTRSNAYIGRSSISTNAYFDGVVDALRIYDYAVTSTIVAALYSNTQKALVAPAQRVFPNQTDSTYTTAPQLGYTFDVSPPPALITPDGTSFTWVNGESVHTGVASFAGKAGFNGGGTGDYIDMNAFPDGSGYGNTLATRQWIFSNSFTIETWAKFLNFDQWSRIVDIAGPQGELDNNIILANVGTTSQLAFQVYYGSQTDPSGAIATSVYVTNGLKYGVYQHITCVVARNLSVSDSSSSLAATYYVYLDGVLAASPVQGYMPRSFYYRNNAYIGKSNWGADARFDGEIDGIWFYNTYLTPDAVAAHAQVNRPPVYELTFAEDPRIRAQNTNNAGYAWQNYDSVGAVVNGTTVYQQGVVTFSSTLSQYIDLNNVTLGTPNSVATRLPIIGGAGSGLLEFTGWTIEVMFKTTVQGQNARIFDWSNGAITSTYGNNTLALGMINTDSAIGFSSYYTNNGITNGGRVNCIGDGALYNAGQSLQMNTWYHVAIVITPNDLSSGTAIMTCYVNSQYSGQAGGAWPAAVRRNVAYLGRSEYAADKFFDGSIDALRVYDIALQPNQITKLYTTVTNRPSVFTQPKYWSGPLTSLTFDAPPLQSAMQNNGFFGWSASSGSRQGLATFDGVSQYVSLMSTFDSNGNMFPSAFGGDFTFEVWVYWNSYTNWARVFDIGNGAASNNILLAHNALAGNSLSFQVYSGATNSDDQTYTNAWGNPNRWIHVAVTGKASTSVTAPYTGLCSVYLNGSLLASTSPLNPNPCVLPVVTQRLNAYLGHSDWAADSYFNGSMDSFYYYNYAVTPDQVVQHMALPRLPIVDLTFYNDPRIAMGTTSTATYSWLLTDGGDSNSNQLLHTGLIRLTATSGQYVDLSSSTSLGSLGTIIPNIGGVSAANIYNKFADGYSIELVFKPTSLTNQNYAKVFDLGDGAGLDNIMFGYLNSPSTTGGGMYVQVFNSRCTKSGQVVTVLPSVNLGAWYHIVFLFQSGDYTVGTGYVTTYVNGVANTTVQICYPVESQRSTAYLGKSTNQSTRGDATFDGFIDRFAIFDYILPSTTISTMVAQYGITVAPQPPSYPLGCNSPASTIAGSYKVTLNVQQSIQTLYATYGAGFGSAFIKAISSLTGLPASPITPLLSCTVVTGSGGVTSSSASDVPSGQSQITFYVLNVASAPQSPLTTITILLNSTAFQINTAFVSNSLTSTTYVDKSITSSQVCAAGQSSCGGSTGNDGGGGGLSSGAIAGIIIGVVIGVIILVCIILFFCFNRAAGTKKTSSHSAEEVKHTQSHQEFRDEESTHRVEESNVTGDTTADDGEGEETGVEMTTV